MAYRRLYRSDSRSVGDSISLVSESRRSKAPYGLLSSSSHMLPSCRGGLAADEQSCVSSRGASAGQLAVVLEWWILKLCLLRLVGSVVPVVVYYQRISLLE